MRSKNILKPPTVLFQPDERFSSMSRSSYQSNFKENKDPEERDFLFTGYQCDICEITPIRNIRYHCHGCEDYDVCF